MYVVAGAPCLPSPRARLATSAQEEKGDDRAVEGIEMSNRGGGSGDGGGGGGGGGGSADDPLVLNKQQILLAAQHFLDDTEANIRGTLQRVLEGHQRQVCHAARARLPQGFVHQLSSNGEKSLARDSPTTPRPAHRPQILGTLTVEELYKDRQVRASVSAFMYHVLNEMQPCVEFHECPG